MSRFLVIAMFTSSLALGCADRYESMENPILGADCTLTQGFWKNHADAWPVSSVELGKVAYSKTEALAIFGQPVNGNGLVSLAHQLLAAKLNVASGSTNTVATELAQAD